MWWNVHDEHQTGWKIYYTPCRHGTTSEPILNQYYICSGPNQSWTNLMVWSVWLWFTYVRTHPFTFWFSRTDPESKMPAGLFFIDFCPMFSFSCFVNSCASLFSYFLWIGLTKRVTCTACTGYRNWTLQFYITFDINSLYYNCTFSNQNC